MSATAALVVVAAGASTRFGDDDNKILVSLGDRPVLAYSLETAAMSLAGPTVVVCREQDMAGVTEIAARLLTSGAHEIVAGGETRQASELAGLRALAPRIETGDVDVVAIHDGARPFLTSQLLETVVARARTAGGAIPGSAPVDAVWRVEGGRATSPIPKEDLRTVQTPQAFRARPLLEAYTRAEADGFVGADTAATVAAYSKLQIEVVAGDANNIKLTHPEDLARAVELSRRWLGAAWVS